MSTQLRVLVTGSRDWDIPTIIEELLNYARQGQPITLIHGDCPTGADRIAHRIALRNGWEIEIYPADWAKWGKKAGYIRNAVMVKSGISVCLAFIKDGSKGASMCAKLAENAGVETFRIRPVKISQRGFVHGLRREDQAKPILHQPQAQHRGKPRPNHLRDRGHSRWFGQVDRRGWTSEGIQRLRPTG